MWGLDPRSVLVGVLLAYALPWLGLALIFAVVRGWVRWQGWRARRAAIQDLVEVRAIIRAATTDGRSR